MSRSDNNNTNRNDIQSNVSDNKRGNRWLVILLSVTCVVLAILLILMTIDRCSSKKEYNTTVIVVDSTSNSGNATITHDINDKGGRSTVKDNSRSEGSIGSGAGKSSAKKTGSTKSSNNNISDNHNDGVDEGRASKDKKSIFYKFNSQKTTIPNKTIFYLSIAVFVSLLVCYIVARVRSKRELMVVTASRFDEVLMYLAPILFFVAWCIGFDHKLTQTQLVIISISGLVLLASFGFSIWANFGSVLNIGISIFAKLFIFVLTFMLLLLLIIIFFIILFVSLAGSHNDNNDRGSYAIEYDDFLDRWVCYRID